MILSICPGVDLWSRAFEDEGYFVVRAGDPIFGQRGIQDCHPPAGYFEGVIAGIPCQPFSVARNGHKTPPTMPDLTNEVERVIFEAQPDWWLTENVIPRAPIPQVEGYQVDQRILYAWDLGVRQRRGRRFCVGARNPALLLWPDGERTAEPWPTVTSRGMWTSSRLNKGQGAWGHTGPRRETPWTDVLEAFGLPEGWDAPALTRRAARLAVVNSVPLPVAKLLAQMIKRSFPK